MRRRLSLLTVTVAAALLASLLPPVAAPASALPAPSTALTAARSATDWWYANGGGATADASWRWTPYFMGVEELSAATGDPRYRQWLQSWGDRNGWRPTAPASPTSNPDARAAIQVWESAGATGVTADLGPSDAAMAADLSLPAKQYWWIDSLFMGLPLWSTWTDRTGDPRYRAKGREFYDFLRTRGLGDYHTGCAGTGLFDPTESLWWRDCSYVTPRDALGHKVFWARGNGWVMAALARTLMELPPSDPQYAVYAGMLQQMAARVAALQPADGLWRSSLLSPSLFPAPETSGTALFTYAMAYGVRTGVLDRATYEPVVQKAWDGMLQVSLRPSGFLSNCQGVGEAPGAPSTTSSIAYCVGAFTLAATELAQLSSTPSTLAGDAFARTGSNGWGTAVTGGAWAGTSAAPGSFSVAAGTGRVATPAGTSRAAYLPAVSAGASDVRASIGFTRPTTGSAYVGAVGRRVRTAEYAGRVVVAPSGTVRLQLRARDTTLAQVTVSNLVFGPSDRLTVRVQVSGSAPARLRAKVWRTGTTEPTGWSVTGTDTDPGLQGPGAVGLSTYFSAGGRPGTLTVAFDDFAAGRP